LDELFLLQGMTAPEHFASISQERKTVTYLNHEGVPEVDGRGNREAEEFMEMNRFGAVSLFKQNPHCFVEGCGLDDLLLGSPEIDGGVRKRCGRGPWQRRLDEFAKACISSSEVVTSRRSLAFWAQRAQRQLGSAQYFLAYANGKSAVRVHSRTLPNGVHRFGETDFGRYWNPQQAAVLHYAHGAASTVIDKLRRLSNSTGIWWKTFELYSQGRNLDDLALQQLYREAIALYDFEEAQRQVQSGMCFRFYKAHEP